MLAVRKPTTGNESGFQVAVLDHAHVYECWFSGESGVSLPWATRNGKLISNTLAVEEWLDFVARPDVLGRERLEKILNSEGSDKYKGYGGYIVIHELASTGRVITDLKDMPTTLNGNTVYTELAGFDGPVAVYGTSDVANMFELLQLLKMAHWLGIPAVFGSYPNSHNMAYWADGFLYPSLKLIGSSLRIGNLGLDPKDKYTQILSGNNVNAAFSSDPSLAFAASYAQLNGKDMRVWEWYQAGMRVAAQKVLELLGIEVPLAFTTTEELLKAVGYWDMPSSAFAEDLEKATGYTVVAFNTPGDLQIKTRNRFSDKVTVKNF